MVAVILEVVTHNWKWTDGPVRISILRHEQRQPGYHGERWGQRRSSDLVKVTRTKWTLKEALCSLLSYVFKN